MGFSLGQIQQLLESIKITTRTFDIDRIDMTGTQKFGENTDISNGSTPEDIWTAGGLYPWPAAATVTTVISSDPNDDDGDTGANTILVQGLDSDYRFIDEVVVMNGVGVVALTQQFLRVFRAFVLTAGASNTNEGTIDIKHGAIVIAQIPATRGQTLMAIYTVPLGISAYLKQISATILGTANTSAEIDLQIRLFGGAWRTLYSAGINLSRANRLTFDPVVDVCPAKTDVRMTAIGVSGNNIGITARFGLIQGP